MAAGFHEIALYGIVGAALILQMYIVWDIYRKDFRDEWSRTLFLAAVMLIPIVGMVIYAVFSHRFMKEQDA
ncbi:PLDc N-terminal domain-containing protein [Pontibacter sp. HSC-36F09]|uniref:PLDc N-terminal domain-containing protein n=1 Tax=Pontibacter sp. HSC-36F09 TaxID=2910966 RepID=UPI00209DDC52|nr:PLDc N-terminal domain-containing protein [Pontibacter sp. HSC-36F09]MCP2042750.1 preprotein translocase subunit Sss1 [Pontibacter sp. HSC-36F09]